MDQIFEFFEKLFRADSWPARWHCGRWTEFHGWLYIISDVAIWAAYFAIPFFLIRFVKKKPNIPLPSAFWLFGAFILFCGMTHLMDAIIFWWPDYRLSALIRFMTAAISWITVVAIYKFFPVALVLRTSKEFDIELLERKKAENEIKRLNENLERLVNERTMKLELALQNEQTARSEMTQNQLRLAFLTEASEVLSASLDYSKTLVNMAGLITPKIADWCAIDEVEDDGSVKRLVVSHVDPQKIKFVYDLVKKYPTEPNASYGVNHVVRTRKPELYSNIPDELIVNASQNEEHLKLIRDLGFKSAIIMPLLSRDKIYGVITLVLAESGRLFNEDDLEFAKELARRATLAIENAKLYKELQDVNEDLEIRVTKRTLELEAINKELEAFSYSVSHDLRAPLRSIDGFSNKILKDYAGLLDEQGKDYFMRVKNASQRMGVLIDDLLKLSRLSRVEISMETTNLSDMAESIVNDLKASDPERKASFQIQKEMMAKVDRSLVQIALQNLLGNAWKYSKNQPEAKIEFGTFLKDGQTVYFIRDNGVGFDMKYVDKLFGAFQRLHSISEFEGTGIGLATVQRIIRRHQGTIWVDAEINKGATFFFSF